MAFLFVSAFFFVVCVSTSSVHLGLLHIRTQKRGPPAQQTSLKGDGTLLAVHSTARFASLVSNGCPGVIFIVRLRCTVGRVVMGNQ